MKYLPRILAAGAAALMLTPFVTSCDDDKTTWEEYAEWREDNEAWVTGQSKLKAPDGTTLFERYTPPYNAGVFLLQRTIGEKHTGNLKPLYTSTVTVNYEVHLYNDTLIDKGTEYVCKLNNTSLIDGWSMAIMNMNAGDSAEVILPYLLAYGPSGYSGVPPYSALRFNIRLVDVDAYQVP